MEKLLLFILLLPITSYSQYDFYVNLGVNSFNVQSKAINTEPSLGYEAGIGYKLWVTKKNDIDLGLSYANYQTKVKATTDINNDNPQNLFNLKYNVEFFNLNTIYNHYFVEPYDTKFHYGLSAGFSMGLLRPAWKLVEKDLPNQYVTLPYDISAVTYADTGVLNFNYIVGTTFGTERIRINISYKKYITNILRPMFVIDENEGGYYVESKPNAISLKLFYLF